MKPHEKSRRDSAPPGRTPAPRDVVIEKWVYGGDGLARIDGGRVVLVPFVLPGEHVRVQDTGRVHASLGAVHAAAPERVTPSCPLFTACGGCHYQHAAYQTQLAAKVAILREQLHRLGKIEYSGEVTVRSGPQLGYRNRVQLHVERGQLGYRAPRSHELVFVDGECPIASPRLNQAIDGIRERVAHSRQFGHVRSVEIFTDENTVQLIETTPAGALTRPGRLEWESREPLEYATGHGVFRVSPGSFFQVNRFLIDELVTTGLGDIAGQRALDLYAGVGLFSLPLCHRFDTVTAVESAAPAADDLASNCRRSGMDGTLKIVRSPVAPFLSQIAKTPDFVLADPPRAGLGRAVTSEIERLAPPRLALISCDPSTLARDLAEMPSYRIETLTLVDLFPQTYHLETVVHLTRTT